MLLMVDTSGLDEWGDLLHAPSTDVEPERMGNLRGLAAQFGFGTEAISGVISLIARTVVMLWGGFRHRCAAPLLGALLLNPRTDAYALLAVVAYLALPIGIRLAILPPWPLFFSMNNLAPFALTALMTLFTLGCLAATERYAPRIVEAPLDARSEAA